MVNPEIIAEKGGKRPNIPDWCKSLTGRKKLVQNKLPHFDVVYINSDYVVVRIRPKSALAADDMNGGKKRMPWPQLALADDAEAAENLCMMASGGRSAWSHNPQLSEKQKARYYELALKALEKNAKPNAYSSADSEHSTFGSECMCEYAFDFDIAGNTQQAEKIYKLVLASDKPSSQ